MQDQRDAAGDQLADAVRAVEQERLTKLGLAALDRFQDTWNTRDAGVWAKSLHFPHVRPSAGNFAVAMTAKEYVRSSAGVFERVLALGWHRSQWNARRVVHLSGDKMHIAGEYTRYRENGERISTQQVTYIVTRQGGRWGVKSRFGTGRVEFGEEASAGEGPARAAVEAFNSLDNAEPIQAGASGVNVTVRYSRLNSQGEKLSTYDAVYLVTNRNDRWAVQARSSYAP